MNIAATELKSLLRKLSPAAADWITLDAISGRLLASGPELTMVVESDSLCEKSSGRAATVSCRQFSSIVTRLSGTVDINLGESALTITSAKAKLELELAPLRLPVLTVPKEMLTLPLSTVQSLLKFTAPAADPNKAAPHGGGIVQLRTEAGVIESDIVTGLRSAATDGKRIAFVNAPAKDVAPFQYAIPLAAVAAILHLDGNALVFGETGNGFLFQSGAVSLHAAKLAKNFPDFGHILPKTFTFSALVPAEALRASLHLIEPMLKQETGTVSLHFLDKCLRVSAYGATGKAEDEITYQQVLPDPVFEDMQEFRIGFHHTQLRDALAGSGEVKISANGPDKPVLFEAGEFKTLLAPYHL